MSVRIFSTFAGPSSLVRIVVARGRDYTKKDTGFDTGARDIVTLYSMRSARLPFFERRHIFSAQRGTSAFLFPEQKISSFSQRADYESRLTAISRKRQQRHSPAGTFSSYITKEKSIYVIISAHLRTKRYYAMREAAFSSEL